MKDFYKYLAPGESDKSWGLFLNVAGKGVVPKDIIYPDKEHPTSYHFSWENGRKLHEFQIIYITDGSGVFENKNGEFPIIPGTLMVIRKNSWHRYRPNKNTGWTENYIGFDGKLASHFLEINKVLDGACVIHCGFHEELIDTYYKIFNLVLKEKPGFQQIATGLVIKLIGHIVTFQKQKDFTGKAFEKTIENVRFHIRQNINKNIDMEEYAQQYNLSYSYFRKIFKEYTGVSPHQYYLDLKIMRSKELILTTDKSIKEISFDMGFESTSYFSRLFKQKTGINPSDLRLTTKPS